MGEIAAEVRQWPEQAFVAALCMLANEVEQYELLVAHDRNEAISLGRLRSSNANTRLSCTSVREV